MTENYYGMDCYQQFIFKSRYAKWRDDLGRRETWDETVKRYFDFFEWHLKEFCDFTVSEKTRTELETAVLNQEIMPSMRALMTAGPALAKDNIAGYNCFSRDTKFVTDEGIRSFSDFEDGDLVNVLGERRFKPAIVKKFGIEKLYRLEFRKGNSKQIYLTTANHRWIVIKKHGNTKIQVEKTTTELSNDDILKYAPKNIRNENLEPCKIGIQHGMVFGDGTFNKNKGFSQITLCGDSVQFENMFTTGHKTNDDRDKITFMQLPWNWKQLPDLLHANRSYLLGFLSGWFGADGAIGKTGSNILIHNHKEENLKWFRSAAAKIGIFTSEIKENRRENPFKQNDIKLIYSLSIFRDTLPENFFLKKEHDNRFKSIKDMNKLRWKLYSCNITDLEEDVWCVHEPEKEIFTLANGIQTKNCSYVAIDSPRAFDEILYILMNGTGVGFSVERQYVQKLPAIAEDMFDTDTTIVVADSKLGWAKALKELIQLLYSGQIPKWDTSKVRPAGSPLKTFGGRASGPEPLEDLFRFVVMTFKNSIGRKLTSLECHDVICKTAESIVVGGVRRSALISLSNLSDERMRKAKSGEWWKENVQRSLANNSVAYSEKPDTGVFLREWLALYESKSGERGIFNRDSSVNQVKNITINRHNLQPHEINEETIKWARNPFFEFGTNPCSEIILRIRQFCNLTEAIIRPGDTKEQIMKKVELATILGTWQASLTNFKYISKEWKKNCEEERLLGVSLTGIMDSNLTNGNAKDIDQTLQDLRREAWQTNKKWARKLQINEAAAITCVKPSGTVSQFVDASSGIHARHSPYYIRTVRADIKDPLAQFMMESGFLWEPDVTKPDHTAVFSFFIKSPKQSIFRKDKTAIEQLELWLTYQNHWCEHKPSITVSVKENEWIEVGAWVFKNFDKISGVSFLPFSDHTYRQAPYQDISKSDYDLMIKEMPKNINWEELSKFESEDMTIASKELACSAGGGDVCEIVDLVST